MAVDGVSAAAAGSGMAAEKKSSEETEKSKKKALDLNIDLTASVPSKIPDRIRRVIRSLRDYVRRKDRDPLVGMEYILEYRLQTRPGQVITKYFCEVCDLNAELIPMIEHLSGSRHRRYYLAKDFPYVMRKSPANKEDKNQFLRRMALEIEQEIGLKDFKTDPIIRTVSIMNVKSSEARLSKRNSRWELEGDIEVRKKKALQYLDTIVLEDDDDEARAIILADKLKTKVRTFHKRVTENVLFPIKVAKAKDVAESIMQQVAIGRKPKSAPLTVPQPVPLTVPQPVTLTAPQSVPLPVPLTVPLPVPGVQVPPVMLYQGAPLIMAPPMPQVPPPAPAPAPVPMDEDLKFFKKLKTLLSVIPQNTAPAEGSSLSSKLLMLKALLDKKGGSTSGGQQLDVPAMAGADNPLKQKLLMMLASQNPAAASLLNPNPMASEGANVPPIDLAQANPNTLLDILLQMRQKSGMESALPGNQNIPDPGYGGPMAPIDPPIETLPAGSRPHLSDLHGNEWDRPMSRPDVPIDNYAADRAQPYTRISLSPTRSGEERFQELDPDMGRGRRRPFDDPAWAEMEMDRRHKKRSRWDTETVEEHPDDSLPNLAVDLLKRIRGKDLFTASAILSEYVSQ